MPPAVPGSPTDKTPRHCRSQVPSGRGPCSLLPPAQHLPPEALPLAEGPCHGLAQLLSPAPCGSLPPLGTEPQSHRDAHRAGTGMPRSAGAEGDRQCFSVPLAGPKPQTFSSSLLRTAEKIGGTRLKVPVPEGEATDSPLPSCSCGAVSRGGESTSRGEIPPG